MNTGNIKVWDIAVRLFHWSLVISFLSCFLTEDSSRLHIYSGYFIIVLILCRIIWGFIGSKYARFSDFIVKPKVAIDYLHDIRKNTNARFLGHNPAGAAMIVVLIVAVISTCITGVLLYGIDDHAGPLAFLFSGEHEYLENLVEEVHELFSNFTVALIVIHISGVIIAGKQHNENLVKSMINGYKKESIAYEDND
ncbi:MAG: cytochrome b/b6 domain-containing protein [Gammaproteobacteria bacterium]